MMKKKIEAKIIADSVNEFGNRITTFLLIYPRFIHSELMTHRMFSRNSASSRAIPFSKVVQMVKEDPFVPIAWQKSHIGMQGNEYISGVKVELAIDDWIRCKNITAKWAQLMYDEFDVTKQLCNRLLEPFMWHTTLVTATDFENFFELRCPKYRNSITGEEFRSKKDFTRWIKESDRDYDTTVDELLPEGYLKINTSQTEIHMQALAEAMWDAYNESKPKKLDEGEWHIPFENKFVESFLQSDENSFTGMDVIKVSTARCARLSYMSFDGDIDYAKDIKLHDQLLKNKHFSPFEHCAECKDDSNLYANFKGWQSYRNILGY